MSVDGDPAPRSAPLLLLAPMEGLLDHPLRDVLTRVGGIDRCVAEFVRVSGTLLPERTFTRIVPELLNGGRTAAGTPVRAQLLGSDPGCMAENAVRLAGLGPAGIDLNFGCPAKIVNRHGGGAALLREPEALHAVVSAVRRAVPAHMPVSAKMRLGYNDDALALDCARALEEGGACELVVHGRTRAQGYRPPADWNRIADIRATVSIPVIANGDIFTLADARRCRAESGCEALMLGRGMVADPGLALAICADAARPLPWPELLGLLEIFWTAITPLVSPRARGGRIKQWLHYLRQRHPEADAAFLRLRTHDDPFVIERMLFDPDGSAVRPDAA